MNCLSVNAVLDLFTEDLLSQSRRAAVEAHLAGCPSCAAAAGRLRAPRAPAAKAPAALKDRLRKTLAAPPAHLKMVPDPNVKWAGNGSLLALAVFSLCLLALHALTPGAVSERPVASDEAPWSLP